MGWTAKEPWVDSRKGKDSVFFEISVQAVETHLAFCSAGFGGLVLWGVKEPKLEDGFRPNAEVRNEGSCTSTAPIRIHYYHRDTSTCGADVE